MTKIGVTFTVGGSFPTQGFDVMDPMFLFVGRLAVQKGPDLLLEAPIQEMLAVHRCQVLICLVCLVDLVRFFFSKCLTC